MNRLSLPARHRRRLIPAALLAAGLTTALATAGCGSASVSNAIDPVADAATVSNAAPGYQANFTMQISSSALPAGITASGTAAMDLSAHAGQATFSMQLPNVPQITQALGSSTLTMQEVYKGSTFYLKMPAAIASKLPGGKPWLKIDLAKLGAANGMPGLGSLTDASPMSSNPADFLQYLRGSGNVKKVGSATIDGRPCTEYQGSVDLSKVPDLVPAKDRAEVRSAIQRLEQISGVRQLPVSVWVDGQHLVRRMVVHMNMTIQGQTMAMVMQMEIPTYGAQPLPTLPPTSQVTDASSLSTSGSAA